jgi:Na+/proline symporter
VPGIAASQREDVFGIACRQLLPIGGLGLMIACVLAANMSTCSAFMVDTGALFTQNLYRRYLRPEAPDRHYLLVGRLAGLVVTLGAIGLSFAIPMVLDAILFGENLAAIMGVSFVAALTWRRANRHGAWASVLVGLAVFYGGTYLRSVEQTGGFDFSLFVKWHADLSLYALTAGSAAMILVSLLTPAEADARLDDFYRRLHTPAADPATGDSTDEPRPE